MGKYIISKDGNEIGPFSLSEVIAKITKRELELFDYVFSETKQDWILLTEHEDITKALKAQKPKAPPKSVEAAPAPKVESPKVEAAPEICPVVEIAKTAVASPMGAHDIEWYVMKGQTQFGPFPKGELIRMLQERTVYEFDFVWNASMKDWMRLAEVSEFSAEEMKKLHASKSHTGSFLDRKHERTQISGRITIHNNEEFWVAEGKEISAGGIGLFVSNAMIVPGQQLRVHVPSMNGKEAFNAIGEVVSKKFSPRAHNRSSRIEYGIRFLNQDAKSVNKAG